MPSMLYAKNQPSLAKTAGEISQFLAKTAKAIIV